MEFPNNKIAHRGVHNNTTIPENSLKSFKKAMDLGFGIELDVQLTKDDVLVVFHDDNLSRMTGVNQFVSDAFYLDIKKYSLLDSKEKIPSLQKVLELVQGKVCLNIEIKSCKRRKKMIFLLMKVLSNYHNYVLQSFDSRVVRYIKKNYPDIEVGYIINKKKNLCDSFLNSKWMIHYSKADFIVVHKDLVNTKMVNQLKEKMPIMVWTIKKEDTISNKDYILICNNLI